MNLIRICLAVGMVLQLVAEASAYSNVGGAGAAPIRPPGDAPTTFAFGRNEDRTLDAAGRSIPRSGSDPYRRRCRGRRILPAPP